MLFFIRFDGDWKFIRWQNKQPWNQEKHSARCKNNDYHFIFSMLIVLKLETVISCFDGNFNSLSFLNKTICNFHCFLTKNFFWWTKERTKLDFALWGIFPYEKKNHARRDIMVRFTLYVYAACNLLLRNFFH